MAILLTETSDSERYELVIRNRQPAFASVAGVFAALTLLTLLQHTADGLLSLGLGAATTAVNTYLCLYFSVLRTRIVVTPQRIVIRHAGLLFDVGVDTFERAELDHCEYQSVDNPLTANKMVAWSLSRKDGRRKTISLVLPRLAASAVLQRLKASVESVPTGS